MNVYLSLINKRIVPSEVFSKKEIQIL